MAPTLSLVLSKGKTSKSCVARCWPLAIRWMCCAANGPSRCLRPSSEATPTSRRFSPPFTASATRCSPSVCTQCRTTASSPAANTPHPTIPSPITVATSSHSSTACPPGVLPTAALCSAERTLRQICIIFRKNAVNNHFFLRKNKM